jgi:hypothetical protein
MSKAAIGILHPGNMGISIAASAQKSGHPVYWVSDGRSTQTHKRAGEQDLIDAGTLKQMCRSCQTIISVCPPHAAGEVAQQVLSYNFKGLYIEANAISPQRVQHIGHTMIEAGIDFVDGGIIGGPAWEAGQTWLYLSGFGAERAAAIFNRGPLETAVIGEHIGKASALKMCYAAYTKGQTALICAILAAAEKLEVRSELENEWADFQPNLAEEGSKRARRVTAKAWRFAGEMDEIAATFAHTGLPEGFHTAAGDIYRRMSHFKDAPEFPSLDQVLEAILNKTGSDTTVETT